MKEQWKEIKGYENYLISDRGMVFNLKFKRFLKPSNDGRGYFYVNLWKNGVEKNQKIHRLVALAFLLNPENKRTINHIDGCKANNHVSNLEWNTHSENIHHACDTGLMQRGEKNGQAKLNESQVLEIRRLHATGNYTQTALGKNFGVDNSLIGYIVRRKNWKHI